MTHRFTRLAAALVAAPVLAAAATLPAHAATAVPVRSGGQTGAAPSTTLASARQSTGVVLIDTVVDYGTGEAAGTGLVLSQDGIVVTNHHVVEGSTQVEATDPATGRTYLADVVGYEPDTDVAEPPAPQPRRAGLPTPTGRPACPATAPHPGSATPTQPPRPARPPPLTGANTAARRFHQCDGLKI